MQRKDASASRVLLVASSGGHLSHLLQLRNWWGHRDRHWVTFPTADARRALEDESVTWAHHPTTRNLPNALRNARLATQLIRQYQPDLVVTTGAGVGFPFVAVAKARGVRTAYIEVFDRMTSPTLTGVLCYPLIDLFCVQWESQKDMYPDGRLIGWLW
jgi:UDP-N-acetylglucosamine:LPS N-acetylglucosamine transferase